MEISGTTRVLGIIGDPVTHSQSPKMHNAAFKLLELDYLYTAFPVKEGDVGAALKGIKALNIKGCNVTMPHKQEVMPYLDFITPEAQLMGAVNTIVNREGWLEGHNTDGYGMIKSITEAGGDVGGATLLIYGTGGAATAILVEGAAQGAAVIYVVGRGLHKGDAIETLTQGVEKKFSGTRVVYLSTQQPKEVEKAVGESRILINATPLGMAPLESQSPLLWPRELTSNHIVADAVYNPRNTLFLQQGRKEGATLVDGLSMLLWQGAKAFQLFTGKDMPVPQVQKMLFPEDSL